MRHGVDAIAGDVDVQNGFAKPKIFDDVRSERHVGFELHDPVFEPLRGQRQLVRGDHHAFGLDAAHFAPFDLANAAAARRSSRRGIV